MTNKKLNIVEVVWFDAQSSLEPMSIKDMKQRLKPQLTKSIGYLAKETEDYIVLVFMDFGNGIYKHWQVIPVGMIKSKKILRE